mmetsp:Transcript_29311/g.65627  ORF Transcript_29311/g.65627 Transcript_29311/m.65627 type:complete len:300 (-) Transcript_29311:199-1098(-)
MADDEEIQAPSPPSEMTALQRRRAPNAAERQYFGASSVKFGASAPALKQTRPTSRNILTSKIESSGGQLSVAAAPERPQAERRYPKGQGLLLDHLGGSSAGISADAVHTYKPPKSVGLPYPYAQTNYGPTQVQVDGYGDRIFSRGFRNSQEVHRNHLDQKAAVIPHPGRWLRSRGLVGPPPPEQGLQRGTFTHGKSILFESSNQVKRGLVSWREAFFCDRTFPLDLEYISRSSVRVLMKAQNVVYFLRSELDLTLPHLCNPPIPPFGGALSRHQRALARAPTGMLSAWATPTAKTVTGR